MSKPTVAIIGKPNVGKSTFFNYIVGSRISIVEDTPGVTRDRVYAETNWRGRNFTVVDTAGIEPESDDIIKTENLTNKISYITIIILTIISSIAVYYYKNLAIFLVCIFLWNMLWQEKNDKTLAILQGK